MDEWQNIDAVAEVLGCQRNSVRRWHIEYMENGSKDSSAVKEPGRPSKLTINQQNIIQDIILTKTPRDMNYAMALWTNTTIRDTIHDLFRTSLSMGTVNAMVIKMGIHRHQPFRGDTNGNDPERKDWLESRLPLIRKLAKEQNARIFYIYDEKIPCCGSREPSALHGIAHPGGGNRNHLQRDLHALSAVCFRNSQRFMTFSGPLNAHALVSFLNGLLEDTERSLFLIAEPHYKKLALEVDSYIASIADRMSLFFLPAKVAETHNP